MKYLFYKKERDDATIKNLVIKNATNELVKKIIDSYKQVQIINKDQYKSHVFKINNTTISVYKTNTIMFQGADELQEYNKWIKPTLKNKQVYNHTNTDNLNFNQFNIIGNDEVGVGDVFGPLVVTSCFLDEETYLLLQSENIVDSKKLSDFAIMKLAPILKKQVPHKTIIISNQKYNEMYLKYKNTHILKAIAHNEALIQLTNFLQTKNVKYDQIVIDQFAAENKYLQYLTDQPVIIKNNLFFKTKAEQSHLAVAIASIISRYTFLEQINKLEFTYNIVLPLGASNKVKMLAQQYKITHKDICENFIKMHFNLK